MMLTVDPPGAISKSQTFLGDTTLHGKLPCAAIYHSLPGVHSNNVVHIHNSLLSWKYSSIYVALLIVDWFQWLVQVVSPQWPRV